MFRQKCLGGRVDNPRDSVFIVEQGNRDLAYCITLTLVL